MKKAITILCLVLFLWFSFATDWCRWWNLEEDEEPSLLYEVWIVECFDNKMELKYMRYSRLTNKENYISFSGYQNRYWSWPLLFWTTDYYGGSEFYRCQVPMDDYYINNAWRDEKLYVERDNFTFKN